MLTYRSAVITPAIARAVDEPRLHIEDRGWWRLKDRKKVPGAVDANASYPAT